MKKISKKDTSPKSTVSVNDPSKPDTLTKSGKGKKWKVRRGPNKKQYTEEIVDKSKNRKIKQNIKLGTDILLRIGRRIYEVRYAYNISQREFEKMVKIDNSKLAKIENGLINISMLTFHQICKSLHISEKDFFEGMK
jgi:ribosome-binding protein aMBF1 (putative translation factor)